MELETNRETAYTLDPLLWKAMNNNGDALEELFTRYRDRLHNAARGVMGNSDEAEDALQDGLLSAFRNLNSFQGRSQFSTWLTRVVINAARMRLRQRRPEALALIDQQLDLDDELLANRIPDPRPNPEQRFASQERLEILEQKLQSLPTVYRQAAWLCYVRGLSVREAAEVLGVQVGTLKSQLYRARRRLSASAHQTQPTQKALRASRCDSVGSWCERG